ncbi:MAG: hypothetical protein AB8B57_10900 [Congregibacter sp.]
MAHSDEYDEGMVAALQLIWGEGFMAPGGVFSSGAMTQIEDKLAMYRECRRVLIEKGLIRRE